MGPEAELLWPGAALLLLLLGAMAMAGLCVHCSRPGPKRTEKIYEQRNLQERQQSFSVASRTYSSVRQAWPGPLTDTAPDAAPTGKDRLLQFSAPPQDPESARYLNFSRGSRSESHAYIDPIAVDYYNWGCSRKPPEDEDDTNSYENVLVCQPWSTSAESGREESGDYQNSASIHQWQESPQAWAPVPSAAHLSPAGSPDEDSGEPDYVNGDVAREA
ncbi:linker for activation of T-cells family member 2 [Fukomys damarensis]|uniref:linker for activation of T-cells family member 2 n=1 Tax=Fukomys damarensis TaxID=885580 RepID=UPI00053FB889|nr:linker for activation of T-cells family member 2 [Fukomys damarensis]XP_010617341.1 linker for activation of T-cells family member 2 [Fukomys damarensis]